MSEPTPIASGNPHWYAVFCIAQQESRAAAALAEQLHLQVYCPRVRTLTGGRERPAPFFPRYLFVRADLGQVSARRIHTCMGVCYLLGFGNGPQAVPEAAIRLIRDRVEQINDRGGMPAHDFHPDDRVRFQAGPFAGLEAVFRGPMAPSARVRVLVEFLGRLNEVEVALEQLDPRPVLRRGTRGQGRKIHYRDEPVADTERAGNAYRRAA